MRWVNTKAYLIPWLFTLGSLILAFWPWAVTLLQGSKLNYDPTLAVLTATLVALVWYTWETHRLRRETQRQVEVQQRPFVILEPTARTHSGDLLGLKMKNIGNGTAVNIRVGSDPDSAAIPFLAKGETCLLRIQTAFRQEQPRTPPTLALGDNEYNLFLDPASARDTAVFTIQFQNVQMQQYLVKERIASRGVEILCSGRIEAADL